MSIIPATNLLGRIRNALGEDAAGVEASVLGTAPNGHPIVQLGAFTFTTLGDTGCVLGVATGDGLPDELLLIDRYGRPVMTDRGGLASTLAWFDE